MMKCPQDSSLFFVLMLTVGLLIDEGLSVPYVAENNGVATTAWYWDMDVCMEMHNLTYEEQALAFALQGIVNRVRPTVFYKAGFIDFDWKSAESFWRDELERQGQTAFTDVDVDENALCTLLSTLDPHGKDVKGLVVYDASTSSSATAGFQLPIALTMAGVDSLL